MRTYSTRFRSFRYDCWHGAWLLLLTSRFFFFFDKLSFFKKEEEEEERRGVKLFAFLGGKIGGEGRGAAEGEREAFFYFR